MLAGCLWGGSIALQSLCECGPLAGLFYIHSAPLKTVFKKRKIGTHYSPRQQHLLLLKQSIFSLYFPSSAFISHKFVHLEWFYLSPEIRLDTNRAFDGLSIPFFPSLFSQIECISYVQAQDDTAAKWTLYKQPRYGPRKRGVASITPRCAAPGGCQGPLSEAQEANKVSRYGRRRNPEWKRRNVPAGGQIKLAVVNSLVYTDVARQISTLESRRS